MMVSSHSSGTDSLAQQAPAKEARQSSGGGWAGSLPPVLLLGFSLFGALAFGLTPREGQARLAVIGAPWVGLEGMAELVAAADGSIVEAGGLSNVILAQSDSPGFVAALYRAGAWLVLDPAVMGGCLGGRR